MTIDAQCKISRVTHTVTESVGVQIFIFLLIPSTLILHNLFARSSEVPREDGRANIAAPGHVLKLIIVSIDLPRVKENLPCDFGGVYIRIHLT